MGAQERNTLDVLHRHAQDAWRLQRRHGERAGRGGAASWVRLRRRPHQRRRRSQHGLILRQQARLAEAWGSAAERVMPPSAKVVLVPAVMNVAGRTDGLGGWRATLDTLVRRVDAVGPFDVALLSCGGLAQLLGQHLFDTNRSAVVVGGALQVWFGILGKRWKKPAQSRSHPLAQALAAHRPGWLLHPLPEDTPSAKDLDKMGHTADGLYW